MIKFQLLLFPMLIVALLFFFFFFYLRYIHFQSTWRFMYVKQLCQSKHGAIIRRGITCKKIPSYMRDSACRWFRGLLLKKLKYFEVMLNIFEFLRVWENVESWLVFANKLFRTAQPYFLTDIMLLRLLKKKISF